MVGRLTGWSAVVLAVAFNLPYATLSVIFEYPSVLRRPAADVLALFAAGGPVLVLTWYAFYLCALAMVPLAINLAFAQPTKTNSLAIAVGAAIAGSLAGIVQAIGISRWIFVVPAMSRKHSDPETSETGRVALETAFDALNHWAGVAIGEHTGQLLTCLWIGLSLSQIGERRGVALLAWVSGIIAILGIGFGTGEGLAIALGVRGDVFSIGTIIGYLALSVWLVATGLTIVVSKRQVPA